MAIRFHIEARKAGGTRWGKKHTDAQNEYENDFTSLRQAASYVGRYEFRRMEPTTLIDPSGRRRSIGPTIDGVRIVNSHTGAVVREWTL